jgi:hypothetical protein
MDGQKDTFVNRFLYKNSHLIFSIWAIATIICGLLRYVRGRYNNYKIFKNVFWHAFHQSPLYVPYPKEYFDLNHYGVFFSALISPFAILPDFLGLTFWVLANACLLFYAISKLPLTRKQHIFVYLFSIIELCTAVTSLQYNIGIAAIIILSYHFIERKKDFWAAFFIVLGTFTKIYGIVGLAFLPFSRDKKRLLLSCVFWSVFMFLFPMIYTSPSYVVEQYHSWFVDLMGKNSQNLFAFYQNISLLGFVRKVSGSSSYSDLWLILPGIVLFCLPYLRIKQYRSLSFRMMLLASVLLFVVLFSTGSESCSYIIAIIGVAIWYLKTPSETKALNMVLLIFAFVITEMSCTDLFPKGIRKDFLFPFAIKALPCILIWLKICYELCFLDFYAKEDATNKKKHTDLVPNKDNEIDIVLPCYNPPVNWPEIISERMNQMNILCPDKCFHLIVVNDGSAINMGDAEIERFKLIMPDACLISYTENRGKGYALRKGIEATRSSMIIYTDWDFPYNEDSMCAVVQKLENGYDVVVAARTNSYFHHAELDVFRSLMSFFSRVMNKVVLGMKFNDAQGGLKGMNNKGKDIFLRTKIDQFLFDTEFVYLASRERNLNMCEVKTDIRNGVHLSHMGLKVLRNELFNFTRIVYR